MYIINSLYSSLLLHVGVALNRNINQQYTTYTHLTVVTQGQTVLRLKKERKKWLGYL